MRRIAITKIKKERPLLIIGSPMCNDRSKLMNLNWGKMTAEPKEQRMKEVRKQSICCVKIYRYQIDSGKYHLHEHPMGAKSWTEPGIGALIKKEYNILTRMDQCQYGLWIKENKWMDRCHAANKVPYNSPCIASQLQQRCAGKHTREAKRHASLFDGRSAQAHIYPEVLCDATCKGTKEQIAYDRQGQFIIAELTIDDAKSGKEECETILDNLINQPTATEDLEEELQQAWDDVSGRELDPSKDTEARKEEVEYIHTSNPYTKVPRSKTKALRATVITVRWIDINKGDAILENDRSRLVARGIKKDDRPDQFAATPPLEALEMIISMFTNGNRGEKIMVNDVSRAYFSAPARRQVLVELPQEDTHEGEDMVGELNFSMYGTRDAAQNWGEECASAMENIWFKRGNASPCTFDLKQRKFR